MSKFAIKSITLAVAGSLVLAGVAVAAESPVAPTLQEDITTSPGRTMSPADQQIVSSSADKVLVHIARARNALRTKEPDKAKAELAQADTLLDIIKSAVPSTMVTDHIWSRDKKLNYRNTEEIRPAWVPIYASLGAAEDFDSVKMKAARAAAGKTTAPGVAKSEPEAFAAMAYYEEMDLPIHSTRHFISLAKDAIAKNRIADAEAALGAALDDVNFVSVYLPEPLVAASTNLSHAEYHYHMGQIPQAKADVNTAIAQLKAAEQAAGPESQADVKNLLADASSLQGRIDHKEPALEKDIARSWHRTEALADRAMESTAIGWARLSHRNDELRSRLIEAKRYVAYADIDANIGQEPAKARVDLVKAQSYLDQAVKATGNNQDEHSRVTALKSTVDQLLAGPAPTDPKSLSAVRNQIAQAISNS